MASGKYDLLIINGVVVTAEDTKQADIAIRGEIVVAIEKHGFLKNSEANKVIDAEGGWVMPGGIVSSFGPRQ